MRSNLLCDRKVPTVWSIEGLNEEAEMKERIKKSSNNEDFYSDVQKKCFESLGKM